MTSRTVNPALLYLFKNLHCFSAATKSPGDKNVQPAPIHCHSVKGCLVPFLFLIFFSHSRKGGKIYFPKIVETRQMNRGRQKAV